MADASSSAEPVDKGVETSTATEPKKLQKEIDAIKDDAELRDFVKRISHAQLEEHIKELLVKYTDLHSKELDGKNDALVQSAEEFFRQTEDGLKNASMALASDFTRDQYDRRVTLKKALDAAIINLKDPKSPVAEPLGHIHEWMTDFASEYPVKAGGGQTSRDLADQKKKAEQEEKEAKALAKQQKELDKKVAEAAALEVAKSTVSENVKLKADEIKAEDAKKSRIPDYNNNDNNERQKDIEMIQAVVSNMLKDGRYDQLPALRDRLKSVVRKAKSGTSKDNIQKIVDYINEVESHELFKDYVEAQKAFDAVSSEDNYLDKLAKQLAEAAGIPGVIEEAKSNAPTNPKSYIYEKLVEGLKSTHAKIGNSEAFAALLAEDGKVKPLASVVPKVLSELPKNFADKIKKTTTPSDPSTTTPEPPDAKDTPESFEQKLVQMLVTWATDGEVRMPVEKGEIVTPDDMQKIYTFCYYLKAFAIFCHKNGGGKLNTGGGATTRSQTQGTRVREQVKTKISIKKRKKGIIPKEEEEEEEGEKKEEEKKEKKEEEEEEKKDGADASKSNSTKIDFKTLADAFIDLITNVTYKGFLKGYKSKEDTEPAKDAKDDGLLPFGIVALGRDFFAYFLTIRIDTLDGDISPESLKFMYELENATKNTEYLKNLLGNLETYMRKNQQIAGVNEIKKSDPEFMVKKFKLMLAFVDKHQNDLVVTFTRLAFAEADGDDICDIYEEPGLLDTLSETFNMQRTTYFKELQKLKDRFPLEYKNYKRLMKKVEKLHDEHARTETTILEMAEALTRGFSIINTTTEKKGVDPLQNRFNKQIEEFKVKVDFSGQPAAPSPPASSSSSSDVKPTQGGRTRKHGGATTVTDTDYLVEKVAKRVTDKLQPEVDALIKGGQAVINTVTDIMKSEARVLEEAAGKPASPVAEGGAEPTPGSAPAAPAQAAAATPTELLAKITATRKILRDYNANMDTIKKNLNSYAKVLDWDQVFQLVEKVDDEAASSETSIDRVKERLRQFDADIKKATAEGDTGKATNLTGRRTTLEQNLRKLESTTQDVAGPQLQQVSANGKELVGRFKLLTSEGDKFVKELGEMTKAMDDDAGKMKSELIEFWKQFASNPMMSKQKIDQLERYFEGNFTMERVGELKAYNIDASKFAVPDIKSKLTPDQQEKYGWIENGLRKTFKGVHGLVEVCYKQAKTAMEPKATEFDRQIKDNADANKASGYGRNGQNGYNGYRPPDRGGGQYGGKDEVKYKQITDIIDWVDKNVKTVVKTDLDYLERVVKRAGAGAGTGTGLLGDTSMLTTLLNSYMERKEEDGELVATRELRDKMVANNLMPSRVLAITPMDKLVFVVFTMFVRMIVLLIVGTMLGNGMLNKFGYTLMVFIAFYVIILFMFALVVNFDEYRLRIIFNYMNFHINDIGFFMYIAIAIGFSFAIMSLMTVANFPFKNMGREARTDEDRAQIMARLEMTTAFIWLMMTILVILT
jgi:hypothetical protein